MMWGLSPAEVIAVLIVGSVLLLGSIALAIFFPDTVSRLLKRRLE